MRKENEQREALREYQKTSLELNKKKKRQRRKIFLTILFLYVILSFIFYKNGMQITLTLFGEINEKYYDIRLNNHQFEVYNNIHYRKTILPFLVYSEKGSGIITFPNTYEDPYIKEAPYLLTIKSYTCYYPKMKRERIIPCKSNNNERIKENKIPKQEMTIYKYKEYNSRMNYISFIKNPNQNDLSELEQKEYRNFSYNKEAYEEIYKGNFREDITEFINKEGIYGIKLLNKEKATTTTLTFGLINNGEYIYIKTKEK